MSLGYTDLHSIVENEIKRWSGVMPEPVKIDIRVPSPSEVRTIVSDYFDVNPDSIKANDRSEDIVFIRHLCSAVGVVFREKYRSKYNLSTIGKSLGINHAAVIHGAKNIRTFIETKYRLEEISDIAYLFGIQTSELMYTPTPTSRYSDIKVFKDGVLIKESDCVKDLSEFFQISSRSGVLYNAIVYEKPYKGYIIKANIH